MKKILLSKTTWGVLIVLVLLIGMLIPSRICITLTPSLNKRVFWMNHNVKNIQRNDYVLFSLDTGRLSPEVSIPDEVRRGDKVRAMKRVACVSGDLLKVEGQDYYCNNTFIGRSKLLSIKGEKLIPFIFNGIVPEGLVFLTGDHPDSYDSRYYGFIDRMTFQAHAWPIF